MKNIFFAAFFACLVSACGGGGGSTSSNVIEENPIYILQEFGGGTYALMRVKSPTREEDYVAIANLQLTQDAVNGALSEEQITYSNSDGTWYENGRTAVMSTGETITIDTIGVNLKNDKSEYVSRSLFRGSSGAGYAVSGQPAQLLPKGYQTYTGYTEIYNGGTRETGVVSANVNFTTGALQITGTTENMIFSSQTTYIDKQNGQFHTNQGKIGLRNGPQIDASLTGAIFGTQGNGIGGVVNSNLDAENSYLGAFAGLQE